MGSANAGPGSPNRGLFRRIADSFRSLMQTLFPRRKLDPMQSRDETFEPIDVDGLRAELRLVEEAHRYGEKELPAADDQELDGPQERIRQRVHGEIDEAYRRANREAERLFDALQGRAVETLVVQALALPDRWADEARRERREARNKIALLEASRKEAHDRLTSYRKRFNVDRGPALKQRHERKMIIAATVALGIVQALANSLLFAQGMDRGVSQAWMLALLIGVLDVGWHFGTGRIATRVHGHRWFERIPGSLGLLALAFTIPTWNLGMVHLRLGIQRQGVTGGMETWFTSLVSAPFGFGDFISFALLGIGLVCSILAVIAAWSWDEPIPEYRQLGTKLNELDASLGYWRDRDDGIVADLAEEASLELRGLRDSIESNLVAAHAIVGRMERLMGNLESFLRGADRDFSALVRIYRDENRLARSTDPPSYFSQPVTLNAKAPLKVDLREFRSFLGDQRGHSDRLAAIPDDLADHIRRKAEMDHVGETSP